MRALAVLLLITWGAGCGAERRTLPTGAGTPDDAGGVADGGLAGDGGDEGAALGGGEGGEGGDNGRGGAAYWVCTDNDGADPTCEDVDECAVGDDGDNGCGVAADWSCTNNAGADPTCRDCAGVVDGLAERDHCDVCAGGDTGVTPCVQDCQGAWGGVAATDRCGTCDADAATDCGLAISPAADAPATSWEPEMGVHVRIHDAAVVLGDATVSDLATSLTMTDSVGAQVDGETKLFVNEAERSLRISFVPDQVLYGDSTYEIAVDPAARLDVGAGPVNLLEVLRGAGALPPDAGGWAFTTAEMTRFILPILFEYDDTTCDCVGDPGPNGQGACLDNPESDVVEGMCYSAAEVDEIVFGREENQIRGYWSATSQGRLVLSKLRTREGRLLGAVHLRRDGIDGQGQTTSPAFRNVETEEAIDAIGETVDFDRYALIRTREGDINVLSNYRDRDFIASRVENGYYTHFNVYLMGIYGNPGNFDFGSSGSPVTSADINASLSHQDYYGSYKWLHETGHGLFGMTDLYYDHKFPGTGGVFGIMGNHYANAVPAQTSDPWHTILAEIAVTEDPYNATDVLDILAGGLAEAGCGTVDNPCHLRPRYPDGEIWRFPAVIEDGEIVGEYLVEMYGTGGTDANLEFEGVDHGHHPGVISVWKSDESSQKILDHFCGYEGCSVAAYHARNNRWERPEYYPSCPHVMPTEYLARTPIYKTFPWWEHLDLPYVTQDLADLPAAAMPRFISLPVVEVPAAAAVEDCLPSDMTPECRFGGGDKVGTITLGFQATVDALEAQIEANPLERDSYLLPAEVPFTLTFEPELVPTPMNYADHILPQHQQHISDDPSDFCRQVLTDGYLAPD